MQGKLYRFEMPISREDLSLVEDSVRKSGVITLFDPSDDAASILNYRFQKAEYGTQTYALLDLNAFKDILSLAREDSSRKIYPKREAAALCLFFICADIDLEPCMALHENSKDCAAELKLFRQIENVDPEIFLEIMHGDLETIPEDYLPEASADVLPEELAIDLCGSLAIEIGILKLADLIRDKGKNDAKILDFLRWCHGDFMFVREVLHLAFHQLAGNQPKPLLGDIYTKNIRKRLAGIENAKRDLLLIREWRKRLELQDKESCLWLLGSRDFTASQLARELIVVGSDESLVADRMEAMLIRYWGANKGKRILKLYQVLAADLESPARRTNHWKYPDDMYQMRRELRARLIQDLTP